MPIVPLREGQGAQTGTPVAAINTTDSRMMGNAIAQLGGAMVDYAVELQRQSKERDKLIVEDAKAGWEDAMKKRAEQIQHTGFVEGDQDGSLTLKDYEAHGKDLADQIRENPDMSERAKAMFTAEVNKSYVGKYMPAAFSEIGKVSKALGDQAATKLTNTMSSSVMDDPSNYDSAYADLTESIQNSKLYTPVEKAEKLKEAQQTLFNSAIEGFRQRGRKDQSQYEAAKNFVDIYGTSMDPKEKKSLLKELDDQKWQDYTRDQTVKDNIRQDEERQHRKSSDKLAATFNAQYNAATTEGARQKVLDDAVEANRNGALENAALTTLLGNKDKFGKVDDNTFAAHTILNPMTDGKFLDGKPFTFDEARKRVMDATEGPNPRISAAYGNKLVMDLFQYERNQKNNPFMGQPLAQAFKRAETYGIPRDMISKALNGLIDDPRYLARVNDVKAELARRASRGENPLDIVESISARSLGIAKLPSFSGTFITPEIANSPEKIDARIKYLESTGQNKTEKQKREIINLIKGKKALEENKGKAQELQEFKKTFDIQLPQKKQGN